MKTSKPVIVLVLLVAIIAGFTTSEKWTMIQSKKFGFKIEFPKKPTESFEEIDSDIGKLKMNLFVLDASNLPKSENMIYLVNYTEYPGNSVTSENKDVLPTFFKGAVEGAVGNVKGKLISEKVVKISGYEGRHIKIDYQEGIAVINMRMFLVKNKMYVIETITATKDDDNKSMTRFMESFKLVE
jgi:hypothetical protein